MPVALARDAKSPVRSRLRPVITVGTFFARQPDVTLGTLALFDGQSDLLGRHVLFLRRFQRYCRYPEKRIIACSLYARDETLSKRFSARSRTPDRTWSSRSVPSKSPSRIRRSSPATLALSALWWPATR